MPQREDLHLQVEPPPGGTPLPGENFINTVAAVELRAWFYHTIQGLHVSVIKRKLMMLMINTASEQRGNNSTWFQDFFT